MYPGENKYIACARRLSRDESPTSPLYIYGPDPLLEWSMSGAGISGDSHLGARPRIHVDKGAIRGPGFPNFQFAENIHLEGTRGISRVGIQQKRCCLAAASPRRLIRDFEAVHLRAKSVTEMVDLRPELSGASISTSPRIHVRNGATGRPNIANFQLAGEISIWRAPMLSDTLVSRGNIIWKRSLSAYESPNSPL